MHTSLATKIVLVGMFSLCSVQQSKTDTSHANHGAANSTATDDVTDQAMAGTPSNETTAKPVVEYKDEKDAPCGLGYIYWNDLNKCVCVQERLKNWRDAFSDCIVKGGSLLTIPSLAAFEWVKANLSLSSDTMDYWAGATDIAQEGEWKWVDAYNETSFTSPMTYSALQEVTTGTPDPRASINDCLTFRHAYWSGADCETSHFFVCEIRFANKCRIANGGCEHICTSTKKMGNKCHCRPGYKLQGKKCLDIDDCLVNNGGCEDICLNQLGTNNCTCKENREMIDGKCVPINQCKNNNFGCEQSCEFQNGINECVCQNGWVSVKKKCFEVASSAKNITLVLFAIGCLATVPVSLLLIIKTKHQERRQQLLASKKADLEGKKEADSDSDDESSASGSSASGGGGAAGEKEKKKEVPERGTSVDNQSIGDDDVSTRID